MKINNWLHSYFGERYDTLHPELVIDGRYYAIVRVKEPGYAGYILVRKNGKHSVTKHEVLFEGTPTPADFAKMRRRLSEVDT